MDAQFIFAGEKWGALKRAHFQGRTWKQLGYKISKTTFVSRGKILNSKLETGHFLCLGKCIEFRDVRGAVKDLIKPFHLYLNQPI